MVQRRSSAKGKDKAEPARQKPVGGWAQFVLFILLLAGASALWFGRDQVSAMVAGYFASDQVSKGTKRGADRSVPVVVAKVGQLANDVIVSAIGTGRARRSVTLYPKATGEIRHYFVAAGERVAKGQPILQLDRREAELAVKVAKTRLIGADRLMKRAEQLQKRNINSQANVDDARNVVARAEFELQQADEALADREMKAPFDGVAGIAKVELGDRVSNTTAIVTLDDRSELIVQFEVAEEFLASLKVGQKVAAGTPSFRDRKFEGTIGHIDSRIDPLSRTVTVRANIPNRGDLLRPGMSFVVDLTIPGKVHPTVHELALQWRKGVSYVWRVRDGKAEKVVVNSVKRRNSIILIDGGITKGDLVVIEGVHRLRPGRPVRFSIPETLPSS